MFGCESLPGFGSPNDVPIYDDDMFWGGIGDRAQLCDIALLSPNILRMRTAAPTVSPFAFDMPVIVVSIQPADEYLTVMCKRALQDTRMVGFDFDDDGFLLGIGSQGTVKMGYFVGGRQTGRRGPVRLSASIAALQPDDLRWFAPQRRSVAA